MFRSSHLTVKCLNLRHQLLAVRGYRTCAFSRRRCLLTLLGLLAPNLTPLAPETGALASITAITALAVEVADSHNFSLIISAISANESPLSLATANSHNMSRSSTNFAQSITT